MSPPLVSPEPAEPEPLTEPAGELEDRVPALTFEHRSAWPLLMDLTDLAGIFRLPSKRAARDLVRRHAIPHFKLGKRIFIRCERLHARLEELETEQAETAELNRSTRLSRRRTRRAISTRT